MFKSKCLLALTLGCLQLLDCFAFPSVQKDEQFPYHAQLDANYQLKWAFNDTHITFRAIVQTTGWVGLGISSNGKMYPADVTVGWVKDGQGHLDDMHTKGHYGPIRDGQQDVTLLSASESAGTTTLTFSRKLETCDPEDTPILEGTTRVIWAYDSADMMTSYSYHGQNRGAKSLLLLDPPAADSQHKPDSASVKTIDFFNHNYTLPAGKDTDYHCLGFKVPDLGGKHHMIRYEPVVQAGNEGVVHHIILMYCEGPVDPKWDGASYDCITSKPPQFMQCYSVVAAWAIGGQTFDFPDVAGYPMGGPGNPNFFVMEMHYDNPTMRSDIVDNSGIRVTVTPQLRQHDAGVLQAGVQVNDNQIIPPFMPEMLSTGYCTPTCLGKHMPDGGIHVFANMLHSHLLGFALRTRVVRNGTELTPLAQDNNYDFNYQESRKLPKEYTLKKGDGLIVECLYKAPHRNVTTFGGLSTHEEMCLSFVMYYPRILTAGCLASVQYPAPAGHDNIRSWVKAQDWTDASNHAHFQTMTDQASITEACYGGPIVMSDWINPPVYNQSDLQPAVPYHAPKTCV